MRQRIFFMTARIGYVNKSAVLAVLFIVVILALGYFTRGFVRAYVEIKHANVFATNIDAEGWDNPTHAFTLELPADAPYTSFSRNNAASIEIGAVATQTPVEVQAPPVPESASVSFIPAGIPLPPVHFSPEPAPIPAASTAPATTIQSDASSTAEQMESASTSASVLNETPAALAPASATPATSTSDAPAAAPIPESAATSTPDVASSTVSLLQQTFERFAAWTLAHTATIAFATSSNTTTPALIASPADPATTTRDVPAGMASTTPMIASTTSSGAGAATTTEATTTVSTTVAHAATSTAPLSAADVAACSILGRPCHTIVFSGFDVSGSLTDKKFKKVSVDFSFANLISPDVVQDDLLIVRYFHNGQWKQAGEIFLNKELSNQTNGGYFSSELNGLKSWQDLSDVKIMIEYKRGSDASARLYLDAVWLDVSYQERAQDVLITDAPLPDDAPGNVTFGAPETNANNGAPLILPDTTISFPYSSADGDLMLRADKQVYAPAGASTTVYVSVTNTTKSDGTFHIAVATPQDTHVLAISQFKRNIPIEIATPVYQDVTYFCAEGWRAASSSTAYHCIATGASEMCDSLDETGVNCTVPHVAIDTATSTRYETGWVALPMRPGNTKDIAPDNVPTGYAPDGVTAQDIDILAGQTIYLRLTFDASEAVRFALFAEGSLTGSLDSSSLALSPATPEKMPKAKASKKARIVAMPLYAARYSDQLSSEKDFGAMAQPTFRFRFRTQRSIFQRMRDAFTGTRDSFRVKDAVLVRDDGTEARAPVSVSYGANNEWTLAVDKPPRAFKPGKYRVNVTLEENKQEYHDAIEFYWGVLAVNTDKQPYAPGDIAHLALAALDDDGNTICDAKLSLTITAPSGKASDVPVSMSGSCAHNNVTDVPDYLADYPVAESGTYHLQLERLDDNGTPIAAIQDAFFSSATSTYWIARSGPTRIYPPSAYPMRISVHAKQAFHGTLREVLPEGFAVTEVSGGTVSHVGDTQYIDWDVSIENGETKTVSYQFKAPDVSPYLFMLGSAQLIVDEKPIFDEGRTWKIASDAIAIATGVAWISGTTTVNGVELNNSTPTALSWNLSADYDSTYFSYSSSSPSQLAVNVDGDYYLALTLPVTRTDTSTRDTRIQAQVYVNGAPQAFAVSRSAFIGNSNGQKESSDNMGVLLHGLHAGDYIEVYENNPNTVNANDHMNITNAASLYVEYIDNSQTVYFALGTTTSSGTNMNPTATSTVYWYDDPSAGRSDSGYTHSNSSSPGNITLTSTGYYLVDVNIPLSGAVTNANVRGRLLLNNTIQPGADFKQGYISNVTGDTSSSIHYTGVVYATTSNTVLTATVFQEAAAGTLTVGTDKASIYVQKLPANDIYESRTKALTGGTNWNVSPKQAASWTTEDVRDTNVYTHSTTTNAQNITIAKAGDYLLVYNDSRAAAVTFTNQAVTVEVNGTEVTGAITKSHTIANASGNIESSGALTFLLRNLAVNDVVTVSSLRIANTGTVTADQDAILMLWRKESQNAFIQDTERWYANTNAQTPTDPWPAGAVDTNQADPITTGNPIKSGGVARLRIALKANVTTTAGADAFKLQYAAGSTCSPALSWADVGAPGSGSIWRGYDNTSVADGSTLSAVLLSVSSTSETYEEQNPSASTPNGIAAGTDGEWDWTVQDNGAPDGTNYCFRMVSSSGQVLKDYLDYPEAITNGTPSVPTVSTPFDNEKLASTTPFFQFVASDPNGEDIHYEVQISTDPTFATTNVDQDSISNFTQFTNVITTSDKAPFNSSETIRYVPSTALINGTTYWWRVRAKDPSGTNSWGAWSPGQSFTVDTSVTVSTWFQTTGPQFSEDTFNQTATSGDTVVLAGANTSGTIWSPQINYSQKSTGNSWGSLSWNDIHTGGTLLYHVEYLTATSSWALIPDADLPGNVAGTSTNPLNLAGLDPDVYSSIRLRADFTKTTATPILNDWTLSWALSVSPPTQTALFDNEKTATTTPSFTFSSTDPQGDDLVYQIQWSTDATFTTGVTTRTSDTDAGFSNTASTTDTSPFTQGQKVQFTVQATDALSNGTTYWWRVRAKDPGGGNAYSRWSNSRSFTVDTSVTVSTWFQTTTDQFLTDIIRKAIASGDSVTVSSDVGKIAVYREATAGDPITTATFWQDFDTTVRQDDIYSMTASTSVILKQGHYAAFYGARYDSTGGTRRSEIQSSLDLASTTLPIGWSQGFMSRGNGVNTAFTFGGGIVYAAANNSPLTVLTFRTDTNTTATLSRTANTSGLSLIRLDDNWDYARLSKSAKQTGPTSANWTTVTYDVEDELDTGSFTHAQGSGNLVLRSPGHYLVFANTYGSLASGSTNETQVKQRLTLDGAEVEGSYTTVYTRGNANTNGTYQGAAAIGMIIQSTTTNQVLNVQVARAMGTASWTINADQNGTYVNRTALTIVKLPEGDFLQLQDSGTQNMTPATLTAFTWNTEAEKDAASWTHSIVTNASRMQVNLSGDYLFLGALYAQAAGITGGVFDQGWRKNGGTLASYGQTGGLSINTTTSDDGNWSSIIFPNMVGGDYAELVTQSVGTAGTMAADKKGVQGLRIASLSEADTNVPTIESSDIHFSDGTGPKWSTVSWNKTTPGSSSITMQVEYASSTAPTGYTLVPDADLPGNSTGTTTSPLDISHLSRLTYPTLRLLATLNCSGGNCPTLNDWTVSWSAGINISGTAKQFDQTTNVTSGTVAVAVNNVLQIGKTGTISGGTWTIPNVTAFAGDVITVFVQNAATSSRAVAITKYLTDGDVTGMRLYQQHVTLGSDDMPLLTNADIGQYDNSVAGSSDVFDDVSAGNTLTVCAISLTGCYNARLLVLSGTTYRPDASSGSTIITRNFQNNGVFIPDGNTIYVANSWKNVGNFVAGNSTVIFTATSTTETIDSTGATSTAFANVTFGSGSGSATWNLASNLYASSTLSIAFGTLAQNGSNAIGLSGDLSIGASGAFSKGTATTTFMGTGANGWSDASASKQDMGIVVIDGSSKTIQLGSSVKATDVTIGSDDTLNAGGSNTIEVAGNWTNNNAFVAQSGTVKFIATAPGKVIAPGNSSFYNLTFAGSGGNWSFSTSTITVSNNLSITAGTVTLPSGTTTVAGSFTNTGGAFVHNNGVVYLTSAASGKSVQADGSSFYDLTFNGAGSWTFADTNATSSRHVSIMAGSVTLPSGTFAVGGSFQKTGGSFTAGSGTLRFTAASAQIVNFGGTSAGNLTFAGSGGSWSFATANATSTGSVQFEAGTTTLPTGVFAIGGNFQVTGGAFVSGTGLVKFNANTTGNIVDPGTSKFYDLLFDSTTGGWTIANNATSTHNTTISNASTFTMASGKTLEVDNTFTNVVGGASTTWSGSTLYLNSGTSFVLNTKTKGGDAYGTLALGGATKVSMWNSTSTVYLVPATASLYSMNHNAVSGSLYIWGTYANAGDEYWTYANDFDGTALGGSSRQVNVRIASGASVTISSGTWRLIGAAAATTTIDNQGAGTYALAISGGTLNAQYYSIRNMGSAGFQFSGTPTVTSLSDGDIELAVNGGSAMTVASTVIDQNPGLQILRMRIATTTAIAGFNVTETGTPTSYWWFRNHVGNLAGEDFDNDPGGNPGYIRWDDSAYDIAVSGRVYSDHGTTAIGNPPCDGATPNVKLALDYGATTYTTSCNAATGAYSFPHVVFIGDVTLTTYLSGGGKRAVAVSRTPTGNIADMDLYQDAVIVRHEDVNALSIANMARYDHTKDAAIPFAAATGTTDTLVVEPGTELVVWGNKTFAPGGNVTLSSGGLNAPKDGRLYLLNGGSFVAAGAQSHSIGGGLYVGTSSTLTTANATFTFTATTSGKSMYAAAPLSFYNLTFNGTGGSWSLDGIAGLATTTVTNTLSLSAGELQGAGDLVVQSGNLSGNGTVNMVGGTVRLEGTGNLGNNNAWQFYDLTLGSSTSNTVTKTGSGTTTVTHVLTLPANTTLLAGSSSWILSGGGTPFILAGTLTAQSAPFSYTSTSATNVAAATYATLTLAPSGAGNPTYTLSGGILSASALSIGNGTYGVSVNANTNDPSLSIGDMIIATNSTLIASNVGAFDVSGNWTNSGTFTHSNGSVRFIATTTGKTIVPGSSPFYDLAFNSPTGGWTITGNATSSHDMALTSGTFTLASSKTLEVGGTFTNGIGGASTTWAGSTLYLNSGTSYTLNTKSAGADTYGTLALGGATNVSMWNSSAATTTVPASASLYSMNHAGINGALNIWGSYVRSSGSDYWDYGTDFDGTTLGTPRQVTVSIASSSSVTLSGGLLDIIGAANATTTIDNQGNGFYSINISGGTLNANYYAIRHTNQNGLNISGSPTITSLSYGDYELSYPGGTSITVAGSAITANPLKIMVGNRFATTTSLGSGFNVTATGSTASSWKFNLHYGNLAGEAFDNDPGGDPGFIRWDDSASAISVSGHVYSDEGTTVSSVCDGTTQNIRLKVQGGGSYTSSCNVSTGAYAITGVTFNPGDTLTLYLDTNGGKKAANISSDPLTNIADMDLYENRVIVRHEDTPPMTIAKMAYWDSRYDTDVPFTVSTSSPNTLTLPSNTKLIIWAGKTFAPGGNITLNSGNSNAWDGTLEIRSNATLSLSGTQSHAIGGSLIVDSGATIVPASASFTFTATTTGKTVQFGPNGLYNVTFNGSGGNWSFPDANATTTNDFTITLGTVTMPVGTTTIGGSFVNSDTFVHNNGTVQFTSTAAGKTITASTSPFYNLVFNGSGGSWSFSGANATSSNNVLIQNGTVTAPSGMFTIGGSFINSGTFSSGTGTIKFTAAASGKSILAGGSSFYNVQFNGAGGSWTFLDTNATTTRDFVITAGSTTLPAGVLTVGGSFTNAGTFAANGGTVRLTATTTGKQVTSGGSKFYNLLFDSSAGGWTITDNATSTHDTTLNAASNFILASGQTLEVQGTFLNRVGGAPTSWTGSTLYLNSGTSYALNTKSAGADTYATLALGASTNIRMWNSSATSYAVPSSASLYSMNHGNVSGALDIFGTYTLSSGADYWSYATDFDGTALGGSSRQVAVAIASSSVVTYQSGATLNIVGIAGATTTIDNQGSGFYSLNISGATLNANYFSVRHTDQNGLSISGSPLIQTFGNGDFELTYPGGTLITVAGSAIDANASLSISGMRFATTTAITGYNVTRTGSPVSSWSFLSYVGNLSGEAFDSDGIDDCGAIRWSNSTCLFVSQQHFRFRNDDGGAGAPDSAWYNASWSKRKSIVINNPNATSYTNVPVQIIVPYATAMRSDFADLRFTDASGTTSIPFWNESVASAASSTVWVKVPSLPGNSDTVIYMYYGNGAAASASDGANTFTFFEDFESGSLASYSGDTSLFNVGTSFNHNHTYGLDAGSNVTARTTNGIYRTGSLFGQGSTISYYQYVDSSQQDEPCTLFAVGGSGSNYAVCLEEYPSQSFELVKNVTSNDTSGTVLASTTITYSTGWYHVVIDWLTSNTINAKIYDASGSLVASLSKTDSSHTSSAGMGFSYWGQHGGWDFYSVRQYLASTPTYVFGAEQVSGGASWATAEDTNLGGLNEGTNIRVRFSIQNTGATLTNRNFRLQVAPLGSSLNCESVPHVNYSDVPTTTGGCGSAVACMKTATYSDGTSIADLLSFPSSLAFVAGYAVADPSNQTPALTVSSNAATEVEYNLQFTTNAHANAYCLRVADPASGNSNNDLDNYQHVPAVVILHPPQISNLSLNNDSDIALTEGATTTIYASSTVSDENGYQDIVNATSTIFRSGVGALCSANDNNCYQIASSSCVYSNCSGNSCTLQCRADIQYFADPTDSGSTYASQSWYARLFLRDSTGLTALATSSPVELLTLYGLSISTPSIDFGSLTAGSDTGSVNVQTSMINTGNTPIGIQVSGTDLTGASSTIPVGQQKYATSTFAYGSCSICQFLTGSATNVNVSLAKPTSTSTPVTTDIYWGIAIPNGTDASTHTGTNTFMATAP